MMVKRKQAVILFQLFIYTNNLSCEETQFYLHGQAMASIDNDSEIQFNLHHEEDEEGQGDVHLHQPVPMEKPDDLPDDAPEEDSQALSPIPVQVQELPMLAEPRRNYSYIAQIMQI